MTIAHEKIRLTPEDVIAAAQAWHAECESVSTSYRLELQRVVGNITPELTRILVTKWDREIDAIDDKHVERLSDLMIEQVLVSMVRDGQAVCLNGKYKLAEVSPATATSQPVKRKQPRLPKRIKDAGPAILAESSLLPSPTPQRTPATTFELALRWLCDCIVTPVHPGRGPKPMSLSDVVYTGAIKTYLGTSGRIAVRAANSQCKTTIHYNSLFNYLSNESLSPLLSRMVEVSGKWSARADEPVASGSSSFMYGAGNMPAMASGHIACGVMSNAIYAITVSDAGNDSSPAAMSAQESKATNMDDEGDDALRVWTLLKSKFNGSVKSKLYAGQVNEVLLKALCHNIACFVGQPSTTQET